MKQTLPYGTWPSPITPQMLGGVTRLEDVQWDSDGQTLVWLQARSGQPSIFAQSGADAPRELVSGLAIRGGVGYGGGEIGVSQGQVFLAEKSGRLYRQSLGTGQPNPITPSYGGVAAPALSPDGQWVAYVFSDGKQDLLALADTAGKEWPIQLARGADFYFNPAWHPSGSKLAWIEYDHPNMPWDGTRMQLATLESAPPRISAVQTVGGGPDIPAAQPIFSPDGRWLAFIEAAGDWEAIILLDLTNGERRTLHTAADRHLTMPDWTEGKRTLAWRFDSQGLYNIANARGYAALQYIGLDGAVTSIDTRPYQWLYQLSTSPVNPELALIASAPATPDRILRWDGAAWHIVARSGGETLDPAWLPKPQPIEWPTTGDATAYGLFYPPTHPNVEGEGAPPAIFLIHGGPTSGTVAGYSGGAAYFTSRGYAYVEVNYRGSTGYGRAYREALRRHWGEYDVDDAVSCRQALSERGLIDPKRSIIQGGSAGGYTVLNALIRHPGVFKAGVCLYGVSNLFTLDMDTHKFEAHYTASMVGTLPEAAGRYHAWSPSFHADKIRDPLIIFQGSEDKVVPPSQSEEIVAALKVSSVPYKHIVYEGEGHGFRKSENIANYYEETTRFLLQHVLFAP